MVLPACCHLSVGIIAGNCRRKANVPTVPRGWGSLVTNDWCIRGRCVYKKIHNLTFDLGSSKMMLKNQLHHVTYSPAKCEVAMSYGSGGDYVQENTVI